MQNNLLGKLLKFGTYILLSIVCSQSFGFQTMEIDYDIVYVRYPAQDPTDPYVEIPQGEIPYHIAAGADLMLLHPDGSQEVLVDCTVCSVMDPYISYDGQTVYYSLIEEGTRESASWLYKIKLNSSDRAPTRLTFDDGFDSPLYAGNTTEKHDQASVRGIRDMAPVPLSDGRLLFTSNRSGLTAFNPAADALVKSSVQQLYVMSDHDGELNSGKKANIQRLEAGNLSAVQHPIQLKDGRILFSSWQNVATKYRYAMTSLFTVNPNGTDLKQFTEPHDHHKNLEHFVTQLADESVVTAWYYPSFDYGFGVLLRYPKLTEMPFFTRSYSTEMHYSHSSKGRVSHREFDKIGVSIVTPHTTPKDIPAPDLSGKYSMPAATKDGHLLVAYSSGSVNHFDAVCGKDDTCEALRSGIYLVKDATQTQITDPQQLVKIFDSPDYNEIWAKPVLPYRDIYGVNKPAVMYDKNRYTDRRIPYGSAKAIIGTSSMYNREPLNEAKPDPFQAVSKNRELHDGNWTIQGAEAGVYANSEIYGVRIISTPPQPFTKPTSVTSDIKRYLLDQRLNPTVAQYASAHSERWEILGEFPLTHKGTLDQQGSPDTSWAALVPSETPLLIQSIDKNGMTLSSELTWRALKSGEKNVDCGGCHAHSIAPLDFDTTQSGKNAPITNVAGIENDSTLIKNGMWDLTEFAPLLSQYEEEVGVSLSSQKSVTVEFNRDILPILNDRCVTCHTDTDPILTGEAPNDAYGVLTSNNGNDAKYITPQVSKYIRTPQARQSLLVWVAWDKRLDGRDNDTRSEDIDYPDTHPKLNLPDNEKRTIARWVDLGSPIDFPGATGFAYTNDNSLPIINIQEPSVKTASSRVVIGIDDASSEVNWESTAVRLYTTSQSSEEIASLAFTPLSQFVKSDTDGVSTYIIPTPLVEETTYILEVYAEDSAGNANVATSSFELGEEKAPPNAPTHLTIKVIK